MMTTLEARVPQRVAQARYGVLQAFLPHYVDPKGELPCEPMGVRDMARVLASIVAAGTAAKRTRQPAACRTLSGTCRGSLKTRIALHKRKKAA